MSKSILIINGPNLNLLGTREPQFYGYTTLADVESSAKELAFSLDISLQMFQSHHEGSLVDHVHAARGNIDAIINPAGYTHTSVALRDALVAVGIPFIELHIANTHKRESFRHQSFLTNKASAFMMGFGVAGYNMAIEYAAKHIQPKATV